MIDLKAVRNTYVGQDISNVDFYRGSNNPADNLTKTGKCNALYHMLLTKTCDFIVEQYVICSHNAASPTSYLSTYRLDMIAHAAQIRYTHR